MCNFVTPILCNPSRNYVGLVKFGAFSRLSLAVSNELHAQSYVQFSLNRVIFNTIKIDDGYTIYHLYVLLLSHSWTHKSANWVYLWPSGFIFIEKCYYSWLLCRWLLSPLLVFQFLFCKISGYVKNIRLCMTLGDLHSIFENRGKNFS